MHQYPWIIQLYLQRQVHWRRLQLRTYVLRSLLIFVSQLFSFLSDHIIHLLAKIAINKVSQLENSQQCFDQIVGIMCYRKIPTKSLAILDLSISALVCQTDSCSLNEECVNTAVGYICRCQDGFKRDQQNNCCKYRFTEFVQ